MDNLENLPYSTSRLWVLSSPPAPGFEILWPFLSRETNDGIWLSRVNVPWLTCSKRHQPQQRCQWHKWTARGGECSPSSISTLYGTVIISIITIIITFFLFVVTHFSTLSAALTRRPSPPHNCCLAAGQRHRCACLWWRPSRPFSSSMGARLSRLLPCLCPSLQWLSNGQLLAVQGKPLLTGG